ARARSSRRDRRHRRGRRRQRAAVDHPDRPLVQGRRARAQSAQAQARRVPALRAGGSDGGGLPEPRRAAGRHRADVRRAAATAPARVLAPSRRERRARRRDAQDAGAGRHRLARL
ncbi:MAG: hypothetical protein AVDCRST_MAG67-2186, partial [uncultured Solirubrobacteraceae bacterium]